MLSILDSLDISGEGSQPREVLIDPRDPNFAWVCFDQSPGVVARYDISDPSNLQKTHEFSDSAIEGAEGIALDGFEEVLWVIAGGPDDLVGLDVSDPDNISVRATLSLPNHPNHVDADWDRAQWLIISYGGSLELIDVSDPDAPSSLDSIGQSFLREAAFSPGRELVIGRSNSGLEIWSFDGSGTLTKRDTVGPNGDGSLFVAANNDADYAGLVKGSGTPSSDFLGYVFDVSDPDNGSQEGATSEVSASESINVVAREIDGVVFNPEENRVEELLVDDPANPAFGDTAAVDGNAQTGAIRESDRIFFIVSSNRVLYAIQSTETSSPPDKPTLTVFDVTDRTATLEGSEYSHPDDEPHADTQWQVGEVGDDFASPHYDETAGEADEGPEEVTDLEPGTSYEARVRYRDDQDLWSEWSDPVSETVEGEDFETSDKSEQLAPQGFFFGAENGNELWRFGTGYLDDAVAIDALVRPNPVAPAGPQGECIFRNLYLVVTYGTDATLVVTPIVDGVRLTDVERTLELTTVQEVTERLELSLLLPFERDGTERFRYAPRGTWFEVEISAQDDTGKGPFVQLEGVVLEGDVVRESEEATVGV
ncbi:MAG: hypothetical protein ACOC8K_03740 [Gemmatimonadota bacterium]